MPVSYRLPTGEVTLNQDVYFEAWRTLWTKCEKAFPGYRCSGYDPCIHMSPIGSKAEGTFTLPVLAALALKV